MKAIDKKKIKKALDTYLESVKSRYEAQGIYFDITDGAIDLIGTYPIDAVVECYVDFFDIGGEYMYYGECDEVTDTLVKIIKDHT